ncbi:hypothetical protein ACN47E_009450 [Coniothyrium glycines]
MSERTLAKRLRVRFTDDVDEHAENEDEPNPRRGEQLGTLEPAQFQNLTLLEEKYGLSAEDETDTEDLSDQDDRDGKPCSECIQMLSVCIPDHADAQGAIASTNRIRKHVALDHVYETNLSVHTLEQRADKCQFCNLLLHICRGTDGLFLYQSKAYEDSLFNPIGRYDENGISDHEAAHIMYGRRKKTNLKLKVELLKAYSMREHSKLHVRVMLELWTQKREWISYGQPLIEIQKALPIFLLKDATTESSTIMGIHNDFRLGASEKLQLISSWVRTQLRKPQKTMTDFPTRLLYFPTRDRVRLVQYLDLVADFHAGAAGRSGPIPRIPYAALSHRWGTSDHLTATTQNWQELQDEFPIWRLPKTFRDAILLTQQLELRYIWIDALCILQDSSSDWLYESERMGDIFANAAFTIAVHSTRDDSDGFFKDVMSKRPAFTHQVSSSTIGICLPPDFQQDVTNSGLSRRGWVLQERFLSERTIHVTTGQIYLESAEGVVCEDGTLIVDAGGASISKTTKPSRALYAPYELRALRHVLGFDTRIALNSSNGTHNIILEKPEPEDTTLEWLNLVEMYSHCSLTYGADKLVAISGMARKIQDRTRQTWCAGIWADFICQGLLWAPTTVGLYAPAYTRAPSWSWASWDGPIQYPMEVWNHNFVTRSLFVKVQLATKNKESCIWLDDCGSLTIRGRLLDLSSHRFNGYVNLGPGPPRRSLLENLPNATWKNYLTGHGIYDPTDDTTFEDLAHLRRRRSKPHGWAIFDHMHTQLSYTELKYRDDPTHLHEKPQKFLVLGTCTVGTETICLGLLLGYSQGAGPSYKRLGIGHVEWQKLFPGGYSSGDAFQDRHLTTIIIV